MKKIISLVFASIVVLAGCSDTAKEEQKPPTIVSKDVARVDDAHEDVSNKTEEMHDVTEETQETYKDGEYLVDGAYLANKGTVAEDIDFQFIITDGKIASLELVGESSHAISKDHQDYFMTVMPERVIGQNLETLTVDAVAGASDTTTGFRKAVNSLKEQAK